MSKKDTVVFRGRDDFESTSSRVDKQRGLGEAAQGHEYGLQAGTNQTQRRYKIYAYHVKILKCML